MCFTVLLNTYPLSSEHASQRPSGDEPSEWDLHEKENKNSVYTAPAMHTAICIEVVTTRFWIPTYLK